MLAVYSFAMGPFRPFVAPLENGLGVCSSSNVNQSHSIQDQNAYRIRHFAPDNDDGAPTLAYKEADIILPVPGATTLRAAFTWRLSRPVCAPPLTEGELDDVTLPKVARAPQREVVWAYD